MKHTLIITIDGQDRDMSVALHGDYCAFNIGQFGDLSLDRRLFRSIFEKMTVCIK